MLPCFNKNNPCIFYVTFVPLYIIYNMFFNPCILYAEEQRDLSEGITEKVPEKSKWGFLPRFKMNPDTGIGSGIKLKGANVFSLPVFLDLANLFTTTRYQTYEFTLTVPGIGSGEDYWYVTAYAGFYLIPDMIFFGIGNNTKNFMSAVNDNRIGNESVHEYKNIISRILIGRRFKKKYFIALEPFFNKVWISESTEKELPQTGDKYADLRGTHGGTSAGFGIYLVRSTRDNQWRAKSGSRIEICGENTGPHTGSDYSFSKIAGDIRKYIGLFGEYNVLALHLRAESIIKDYERIPWWEMPYIGGHDSLRGYWEGRYRGKRIIFINGECRFHLIDISLNLFDMKFKYTFDGNLFFDAGRSFTPDNDYDNSPQKNLKYSGGFGVRLTTPPNLMGRLDIGFSKEMKFASYFNFGTVF